MATSDRPIFLANLREVTTTSSPVSDILADPKLVRALTRPMTPRRSSSRNSSKTHRSTNGEMPELPLLGLVLTEEARQSNQLKMLLNSTSDRLEYEMKRADAAERRANYAEKTVRQASERIATQIAAQHRTEIIVAQLTEELKRYKMLFENAQGEIERAQGTIEELEDKTRRVESEARRAKEVVNLLEKASAEREAREKGRQEAMRHIGQSRFADGIVEGRREGYETAKRTERERRKQAYDEGFQAGRKEGFSEGNSQGRSRERRKAMEAFDRFLENEGYSNEGTSGTSGSGSSQRD